MKILFILPIVLFMHTLPALAADAPKTLEEYYQRIDYSCQNDSDCVIKDVGNCCGHYPQCVNKDTNASRKIVDMLCTKEGVASVCGFPSVNKCHCVEQKCAGAYELPAQK